MRTIAVVAIGTIMLLMVSCNKSNTSSDTASENLKATETLLNQDYSLAQQYENILVERHETAGMTMTDPTCKMNDSVYHAFP
jgi:hypothetical protein